MVAMRAMLLEKHADRDPAGAAADHLGEAGSERALRAGAAGNEGVGRVAHQGRDSLIAERAKRRLVGHRAHHRIRVELPVGGMDQQPRRAADRDDMAFRDRMGGGQELDRERAHVEGRAGRDDVQRHLGDQPGIGELAAQHRGGERRGMDRAAQPGPQDRHRAQMVLVGMGQHDPGERIAPPDDEIGIGDHHIDTRRLVVAEADAEVDHHPTAVAAIEVEVHADLARTAQRQEQDLAGLREERRFARAHGPVFRRWIEARPRSVISGSSASIASVPSANSGARPPVAITFIGAANSSRIRATSPSMSPI